MSQDAAELEPMMRRCLGYAFALCRDRDRARDLVQDACVAALRVGAELTAPYLLRAVRSRHVDRCRREALVVMEQLPDEPSLLGHDDGLDQPALLVSRERIAAALSELRPVEREVLWLACVEGWTAAEIAAAVGAPRGTVLSHLHRARERIRRHVETESRRSMP